MHLFYFSGVSAPLHAMYIQHIYTLHIYILTYIYIYLLLFLLLLLLTKGLLLLEVCSCLLKIGRFYGILLFELFVIEFHFLVIWKIIILGKQDSPCRDVGSPLIAG